MAVMTKDELSAQIKEVVLPLIKDVAGPMLVEIVEEQQKKTGTPEWAKAFTEKQKEKTAPLLDKGMKFATLARARAQASLTKQGEGAAATILKGWGHDDIAETYEKALATNDPTAGGFLVPIQFSQDLVDVLRPRVVVRALGPMIVPMATGIMQVPKITAGSVATYIGENTNIVKTEPAFGQLELTAKKLAALVPFSNEIIMSSSPNANTIVRNDLVRALASRQNLAFIRGDGTAATPKGMRNWAPGANILQANGTTNLANVTIDLGLLVLQLKNNNIPLSNPAWIFAPRTEHYLMTVRDGNGNFSFRDEMLAGRLWGFPFGVTTDIPINLTDGGGTVGSEIYFVDMDDAVIGESDQIQVVSSGEAAYNDGSNVVAAFSLDQTVIRAIERHDFGMRREESITVLNEVTWGT